MQNILPSIANVSNSIVNEYNKIAWADKNKKIPLPKFYLVISIATFLLYSYPSYQLPIE